MKSKQMVYLVAALVLAVFAIASVSAVDFGDISSVKVNGVEASSGTVNVGAVAGETLPVEVTFASNGLANVSEDVRVKAWISGARDYSVSSKRFVVRSNTAYHWLVSVQVPYNLDPTEDLKLKVLLFA